VSFESLLKTEQIAYLMHEIPKKAVFLDRDGVLIHDVNYLSSFSQIKFYDDVPPGLLKLKESGFLLIVVTNQSGVARGYFTEDFVQKTHIKMNQFLENYRIQIDDFYYCPHHIDGIDPYNRVCECRKPRPGLINKATIDHPINIDRSFMIGDKTSDMETAINAGLSAILVKTGYGANQSELIAEKFPKIRQFDSFSSATDHIIQHSNKS